MVSSKDTTPAQIIAVYENLKKMNQKRQIYIGIVDDVTFTSLEVGAAVSMNPSTKACLFYGLRSDGTVRQNKSSIKIIGDKTDLYAQRYFCLRL